MTVAEAQGFDGWDGLAVWDEDLGGFHTTVARITAPAEPSAASWKIQRQSTALHKKVPEFAPRGADTMEGT